MATERGFCHLSRRDSRWCRLLMVVCVAKARTLELGSDPGFWFVVKSLLIKFLYTRYWPLLSKMPPVDSEYLRRSFREFFSWCPFFLPPDPPKSSEYRYRCCLPWNLDKKDRYMSCRSATISRALSTTLKAEHFLERCIPEQLQTGQFLHTKRVQTPEQAAVSMRDGYFCPSVPANVTYIAIAMLTRQPVRLEMQRILDCISSWLVAALRQIFIRPSTEWIKRRNWSRFRVVHQNTTVITLLRCCCWDGGACAYVINVMSGVKAPPD